MTSRSMYELCMIMTSQSMYELCMSYDLPKYGALFVGGGVGSDGVHRPLQLAAAGVPLEVLVSVHRHCRLRAGHRGQVIGCRVF